MEVNYELTYDDFGELINLKPITGDMKIENLSGLSDIKVNSRASDFSYFDSASSSSSTNIAVTINTRDENTSGDSSFIELSSKKSSTE